MSIPEKERLSEDQRYEQFVQRLACHEPALRRFLRSLLPTWTDVDDHQLMKSSNRKSLIPNQAEIMKHASLQNLSTREKEWVEDYLNGTIEAEAFEALQAHIMESPALRAALRRYLTLDSYLQDENGAAELQVLGTQLNVEAASTSTTLVVNEGRVRLRRLVDGSTAEVPAGFEVTASVDGSGNLGLTRCGPAQSLWKSNLPDDAIRGTWISDMDQLAKDLKVAVKSGELSEIEALAKYKKAAVLRKASGRLGAAPILMGKKKAADGPTKAHLIVLSVSRGQTSPVRLTPGAVFRIHGWVRSDADVSFGLSTHRPNGGFAGKYETTRWIRSSADDTAPFSIELPLEHFRAMNKAFAASSVGFELTEWWCYSKSDDVDLEIMQVELLVP